MLRAQLPFTALLKGATRASYFWAQARRLCDEAGPARGARATHDLDYPCSLPHQCSEGSYRSLHMTWTAPVPKLPCQVGPCDAHQQPMGCLMLALSMEQWELYKPFATEQEVHQTCPLLSWSTLTATLAPPSTNYQPPHNHLP